MLHTDPASYPVWRAAEDLELPSTGEPLEYRVLIVRTLPATKEAGDAPPNVTAIWEPLGCNRRIAPHARHAAKAAHVALVWGEPGASVQWRWEW